VRTIAPTDRRASSSRWASAARSSGSVVNEDDTRSAGDRFADFLAHIDAYHRLYGALLGRKGSPWFADRMRSALAAMSSAHLPDRDADALVPSVISAMFVQSIVWWFEHDRPCPPHELAEQLSRLIRAAIEAAADRGTPA